MRTVADAIVSGRSKTMDRASHPSRRRSPHKEQENPMPQSKTDVVVHVLWINAGLSCDGDSVSLTAATLPSVEEIALGAIPGLPKVNVYWPLIAYENGSDF